MSLNNNTLLFSCEKRRYYIRVNINNILYFNLSDSKSISPKRNDHTRSPPHRNEQRMSPQRGEPMERSPSPTPPPNYGHSHHKTGQTKSSSPVGKQGYNQVANRTSENRPESQGIVNYQQRKFVEIKKIKLCFRKYC